MVPADDPSWPGCPEPCITGDDGLWCNHAREYFIDGRDGRDLRPGMNYCIPIVPDLGLYAEVNLGTEVLSDDPIMVELSLLPAHDPLGTKEMHPLGVHTEGEGRLVVAETLWGWAEGQPSWWDTNRCIHTKHGFKEEMTFQEILKRGNSDALKANKWTLAYKGWCWACELDHRKAEAAGTTQVGQTWNASDFGLDKTVVAPRDSGGGTTPSNAREKRTLDALKQRFGS